MDGRGNGVARTWRRWAVMLENGRSAALDRVRGLAILLMVLDHVLAATGELVEVRWTLTRASLPLFMMVAGALLHAKGRDAPSRGRLLELGAAAACALVLAEFLPFMNRVDVLAVILVAMVGWPLARRWPAATAAVCFVVMATVPVVWDGYHPAQVLGLMATGAMLGVARLERFGSMLPAWLAVAGRVPLAVYVGHLAVLLIWFGGVR